MKTHHLVLQEDLNQYGSLFGGRLLSWVDEASWIAASLDFPQCRFVTIGMEAVSFRHPVRKGTILQIESNLVEERTTSVTYEVNVTYGREDEGLVLFSTKVSFVNVDEAGHKQPLKQR